MRFLVPRSEDLPPHVVERAYVASFEGAPWETQTRLEGDCLVVTREVEESGCLHIPWRVAGHGELVLATTNLMERHQPYDLAIELARGSLNRIRNQFAWWEMAGLLAPERVKDELDQTQQLFVQAVTGSAAQRFEAASRVLVRAQGVIDNLVAAYTEQALAMRCRDGQRLPTLLAIDLGTSVPTAEQTPRLTEAFNSAVAGFCWRDIEADTDQFDWTRCDAQVAWRRDANVRLCSGPLLRLDAHSLPDWLYLYEGDFGQIVEFVERYVKAVVARYHGRVNVWNCAAGTNIPGALSLTEEQQLHLTVRALEIVRQSAPNTPVIVTFDQPWGEYLRNQPLELSPIYFADALSRAQLGVSGFGLEINLGYYRGGSFPRDLLEVSRLLDRWSFLATPMLVFLTIPSADEADPKTRIETPAAVGYGDGAPTPNLQAQMVGDLLDLLLCKHSVQGIAWSQWRDDAPHHFPHGGLVDAAGNEKPALERFVAARQKHVV